MTLNELERPIRTLVQKKMRLLEPTAQIWTQKCRW